MHDDSVLGAEKMVIACIFFRNSTIVHIQSSSVYKGHLALGKAFAGGPLKRLWLGPRQVPSLAALSFS